MNILITSYYYYPELTPRAFRTHELVKEFLRCGHCVTLLLPDKDCYQSDVKQQNRLKIVYVKEKRNQSDYSAGEVCSTIKDTSNLKRKKTAFSSYNMLKTILPNQIKQPIKDFREWKARYLYPLHKKAFIKPLSDALSQEDQSYDLIISIGLPVEVHIGTALGVLKNKTLRKTPVTVADYGDPFSRSHVFFGYQLVDFFIAKIFKYITVPTELAVSSYTRFKRRKNIHVIPQGFNLSDYEIVEYTPNEVPTFAYAGVFYQELRDPDFFLEFLSQIHFEFRFYLYTISHARFTEQIISTYKPILKNKLVVLYDIERHLLIKKLSQADFLINFANLSNNQVPSKLIDYAIAKRPIYTVPSINSDFRDFHKFIAKDYGKQTKVDLKKYEVREIVNSLLTLGNKQV
jgi:hypothetical protein